MVIDGLNLLHQTDKIVDIFNKMNLIILSLLFCCILRLLNAINNHTVIEKYLNLDPNNNTRIILQFQNDIIYL